MGWRAILAWMRRACCWPWAATSPTWWRYRSPASSRGAALYDDTGNGLAFTADGNAQLAVAAILRLLVQTLTVQASAGTTFHGPATFTDAVTFRANVTFGANVSVAGNLSVTGAITGASINGTEFRRPGKCRVAPHAQWA